MMVAFGTNSSMLGAGDGPVDWQTPLAGNRRVKWPVRGWDKKQKENVWRRRGKELADLGDVCWSPFRMADE